MFLIRSLSSQTRIRIHKNFFVSFIIDNIMWYANQSIILTKTFANDMLLFDLTSIKAHKYDKIGLHFANGIIIIMA